MEDSFVYRTTLPPGPRIEPWLVKCAVVLVVLALGIGLFARWVVASERASFARGHRRMLPSMSVGHLRGRSPWEPTRRLRRRPASRSLPLVALAGSGSFLAAEPARLSALQPGFTFVDGPSTTPTIVSVAAGRRVWAAAVLGPSGTCFWVRAHREGAVETGTSSTCTADSVLAFRSSR